MRTTPFIRLIVAAGLIGAACSCSKELREDVQTAPVGQDAQEGIPVRFDCTFDIDAPVDVSKVTVSGEGSTQVPAWEQGDEIKIFYVHPTSGDIASTTATAQDAGSNVTFLATLPDGASQFWAVYPATLDASVGQDGHFSVKMSTDPNDEATFSNACICIARCGVEKRLTFKNLCAILKFTLAEKGTIMQVSTLGMEPLVGTIKASLDAGNNVVYDSQTPYSSTDLIRQYKAASAPGTYYVPVLPLYTIENRTVSGVAVNHLATYTAPACFCTPSGGLRFKRSTMANLGVVDEHIVTDYYFKPGGTGDGSSWAQAAGNTALRDFLACKTDSDADIQKHLRYMHIWKTKGAKLHLAAGTYVLGTGSDGRLTVDFSGANGTVYSEFTIQGGYPAAGGTDEQIDVTANPTVFSGEGTHGILNVYDRARIHINGITFENAFNSVTGTSDNSIARGAALYLKDSYASKATNQSAEMKGAPRVWLNACTFRGCKTLAAVSDNYNGGSAIDIANGAVYANGCLFENNYDKGGVGCIHLSGGYDKECLVSYAFFNACTFTGNRIATCNTAMGSVIEHNRKGGLLGLYNCTFYNNNQAVEDGNKYGWNVVNLNRSAIIANITIVDDLYAQGQSSPGYPIRINAKNNGMNHYVLANNFLMNTNSQAAGNATNNRGYTMVNPGTDYTSHAYMGGGSLFGRWVTGYSADYVDFVAANEYSGFCYNDVDAPSWVSSASSRYFKWNGTLQSGTKTCNFMSKSIMTDNVLKSANINQEDTSSQVTFSVTGKDGESSYAGFYTWLNGLSAIAKDVTGASRPSTGWTPGSYQAQ